MKNDEKKPDVETSTNRRTVVKLPPPTLSGLRWHFRPVFADGNPCWTYLVETADMQYVIAVGHTDDANQHPFEVWTLASEQPRCLGAVAKTLSADMRMQDQAWLLKKLDALSSVTGPLSIDQPMGSGRLRASSHSAALARVVRHRLDSLGVLTPSEEGLASLIDTQLTLPRHMHEGTLSWTVGVSNPSSGDDFTVFLPEADIGGGCLRPIGVRLSGCYPHDLDGLAVLLELDMAVVDVAWIGMKLRKLLSYAEPLGAFHAITPDTGKTERYPSIVAYLARLIIHRYAMLGLLTQEGHSVEAMGVMVLAHAAA